MSSVFSGIKEVLKNLSFFFITMSITFLYWVLTGIQYWFSDYLITELKVKPSTVFISYGVISITEPVIGVLVGGNVISALGGYKSKKALYVTCTLAFVCLSCAIPIAFIEDYITVVVLLWFLLFSGGFILPSMTGIMLNTVD
jgi:sugar phosphate permease